MHVARSSDALTRNRIDYDVSIDDLQTDMSTWKIAFPITEELAYQSFEYACHEGIRAKRSVLRAPRSEERSRQH
jgi:hypothetical protein